VLGVLLGARSLDSMEDTGILPEFAGIVVSDRYRNYFNPVRAENLVHVMRPGGIR